MATNASGSGEPQTIAQGPENPQDTSLQTVGDALTSQVSDDALTALLGLDEPGAAENPPEDAAQAAPEEPAQVQEPQRQEPTPSVEKRIDGLFARLKTIEEKRDALETENAALKARLADKAQTPAVAAPEEGGDPIESVPAIRELKTQEEKKKGLLAQVRGMQRQLRRDPDAVNRTLKELGVQLPSEDPDDVGDWLLSTADRINEELGKISGERHAMAVIERERQDGVRRRYEAYALKRWPWLDQPDDPRRQSAMRIAATRPWLKKDPAFIPLLAMATELMDAANGNGTPATPTRQPPGIRPPGTPSPAIPAHPGARASAIAEADKELIEHPSDEGLEKYLEATVLD